MRIRYGCRFACGSGRNIEKMFMVGDDANAVGPHEALFIDDFVAVNFQEIGQHAARLGRQLLQCRSVGGQPRKVAVGNPPHAGFRVIFGADRPKGHAAIMVRAVPNRNSRLSTLLGALLRQAQDDPSTS